MVRGGKEGSKMQDCMAVLSQREELSSSVPLNPVRYIYIYVCTCIDICVYI
jgi:hypothetical protein